MKNFMYDFYYGKLSPFERKCYPNPNHTAVNRKIDTIREHFQSTTTADDYKRLDEFENLCTESSSLEDVNLFEYGISMGILLMIDVMNFRDRTLTEQKKSSK